ncbi:RNA polymerase associated protein RapA [Candidatus Magnetomorum sp. HK-1]|nr:RNA polymerase associated protein RapA [Candidatus Magnetomorum sp. HK-1]
MKKKSKSNKIQPGQRWMSEMEPELGMGIVQTVERRRVGLAFPASDVFRTYALASAPLRRVRFKIGDRIHLQNEMTFIVKDIDEKNHLLSYSDGQQFFSETEISHTLVLNTPEEKIAAGQIDYMQTYLLRVETFKLRHKWRKSDCFGFVGGCIDLLPHQLFIASEVTKRHVPRVLLADEVGLGKTIEACLIIHRLILCGRINRVLILVPQVLIYQWFVEFFRRFHILFRIADDLFFKTVENQSKDSNPFSEAQLIISSIETLSQNSKRKKQMIEADWDLLVIDEAHHLQKESPLYPAVQHLSKNVQGLLLLSATPEQLGLQNHFARLSLLDPDRYFDYDTFINETLNYQKTAKIVDQLEQSDENDPVAIKKIQTEFQNLKGYKDILDQAQIDKSELIRKILDTHGTGRVMFRNTRSVVKGFPERKVHLIPLENVQNETVLTQLDMELLLDLDLSDQKPVFQLEKDPRILWLADFLKTHKEEKCLLICCYPEKVTAIHRAIQKHMNVQVSLFHENVPLKQRDENAAWFAETSGAQILLCSEMGSEGRNFQFVNHLILFDLPPSPELLEQRIGRLDRIGQKKTIHIHLPFAKNSPQSRLIQWYHDGLGAFSKIIPYAQTVYEFSKQKLVNMILEPSNNLSEFKSFISETQKLSQKLAQDFDAGRDRLLERNSFNQKIAHQIQNAIIQADSDDEIETYTQKLFEHFGVVFREFRPRTYRLKINHRFNDKFSGVHRNDMPVTFDRKKALLFENITFLSWDHPLINDAMELLIGEGDGQCSFAAWEDSKKESMYIESLYILECIAPQNLHMDRFLPTTPIQMLVNDQLKNCQKLLHSIDYESNLKDAQSCTDLFNDTIEKIPEMIKYSEQCVQRLAKKIISETLNEIDHQMDTEIHRLKTLQAINPNVKQIEIKAAKQEKDSLKQYVASARIRIDSIRLIRRGKIFL